jgi:hypothetical protein
MSPRTKTNLWPMMTASVSRADSWPVGCRMAENVFDQHQVGDEERDEGREKQAGARRPELSPAAPEAGGLIFAAGPLLETLFFIHQPVRPEKELVHGAGGFRIEAGDSGADG